MPKHLHRTCKTQRNGQAGSPRTQPPVPEQNSPRATPAPTSDTKPWHSVRPAEVARGKKLIQDENYPTPRHLRAIADLFSRHWKSVGETP